MRWTRRSASISRRALEASASTGSSYREATTLRGAPQKVVRRSEPPVIGLTDRTRTPTHPESATPVRVLTDRTLTGAAEQRGFLSWAQPDGERRSLLSWAQLRRGC